MMTNENEVKIKRPRGRPKGTGHLQRAAQRQGYPGPTRTQIEAMSDEAVVEAIKQLGAEPKKYQWFGDGGCTMGEDVCGPYPKTEEEFQRQLNQGHLLSLHTHQWVDSLDDTQLLRQLENLTGEQLSESAKRYAIRTDLVQQVHEALWAEIHKPTTNNSEKGV